MSSGPSDVDPSLDLGNGNMNMPLLPNDDDDSLNASVARSSSRRGQIAFCDLYAIPGPEPEYPGLPMRCREYAGIAGIMVVWSFPLFLILNLHIDPDVIVTAVLFPVFVLLFMLFIFLLAYLSFRWTDPVTFVTRQLAFTSFSCGKKGRIACVMRYRVGMMHEIMGETEKALECFQEIVRIEPHCSTYPGGAPFHFKVGVLLYRLGRYQEALESFQTAARLRKLSKNGSRIARDLHQVANTHEKLGAYEEALKQHNEALEVVREKQTKHVDVARSLIHVGKIYNVMGNCDAALSSFEGAMEIYLINEGEFPRSLSVARLYGQIAEMKQKKGDNAASVENFRLAVEVFRRGGWSDEHKEVSLMLQKASELESLSLV